MGHQEKNPSSPVSQAGGCHLLFRSALLGLIMVGAMGVSGCKSSNTPVPTASGSPCWETTFSGFPRLEPPMKSSTFMCHQGFAFQYSIPTLTALWVTEHLKAEDFTAPIQRVSQPRVREDAFMKEGLTPPPSKFLSGPYVPGRLAPRLDFPNRPASQDHADLTSNMVAQDAGNKDGIWSRLENNVRAWTVQKGELFVVTGPIFFAGNRPFTPAGWISTKKGKIAYVIEEYKNENSTDIHGKKKKKPSRAPDSIAVPSHLFKVIYDPKANTAIAFVVPNANIAPNALPRYATSVAEVERLTGLRFFPGLSFQEQGALKTRVIPQAWPLTQ